MTTEEFESIKETPKLIKSTRKIHSGSGGGFLTFYRIISMVRKSKQDYPEQLYNATRHIYISVPGQSKIATTNFEKKRYEDYTESYIKKMTIIKSLPRKVSFSLFCYIFEDNK